MIEEKLSHLIEVLVKKTKEGKVNWKATASPNIYLSNFEELGVSISLLPSVSRIPDYRLSLLNRDGEEIESKSALEKNEPDYKYLEELYSLARRSARNVEESLDAILRKLEA